MAVRRRVWKNKNGSRGESWVVDYYDQHGERHTETFTRRKDADVRAATVQVDILKGVHTAIMNSPTVAEAAQNWIRLVETNGMKGEGPAEPTTIRQYRQHVALHIVPRIGTERIASLTTPQINDFRDDLLSALSRPLARKVLTSLKSILRAAQVRGDIAHNVALPVKIGTNKRHVRKLKVGVDIPTPDEIRLILAAAKDRQRPFLITAIFTGLRGSELRALRWSDVDLKGHTLTVEQRADRFNIIGSPKSEAGERTIPIGSLVVNTLREWKLVCPRSKLRLVFPTSRGGIIRHENLIRQIFMPAQIAAGVTTNGDAKYSGLHALRHFYASWCINRRTDGGLELPMKMVQERLGHATIGLTADTYGHLFPRNDDGSELAAAERLFLT